MKRIFGPVPSRRLGRSLGIDVVPYKTCSFDCVYCECGATTEKIFERREFVPLRELLGELRSRLAEMPEPPDVLTLSGAGEPTLYSGMGGLIVEAKKMSGLPVAVITNSSTMHLPQVRKELLEADIVLPSLDTVLEETFLRINRPHPSCRIKDIISGLEEFSREFTGRILLEILLIEGYNTDDENLAALRETIGRLRVDTIQLNTMARPGTDKGIEPLGAEQLETIRESFGPQCEVVASASIRANHEDRAAGDRIISLLGRRPCTAEDIHRALGIPLPAVVKTLSRLSDSGKLISESRSGSIYYTASKRGSS